MKVIFFFTLLFATKNICAQNTVTFQQLMSGKYGQLIMSDQFKSAVASHIPTKNVSLPTTFKKNIIPRSYILKKSMSIDTLVHTYHAPNALELHDLSSILGSYGKGNFNKLTFSKDVPTITFVVYRGVTRTEEYIVELYFSPTKNAWVLEAFPVGPIMGEKSPINKGTQFLTY